MEGACPRCSCTATADNGAHALQRALLADDLDAAMHSGLLEALPCPGCSESCNTALAQARDARVFALAARDRHRAREARLQRRKAERDASRHAPVGTGATSLPGALPPAAADALARALARARERRR